MIETLINIDKQWFLAIHEGSANALFDIILPVVRDAKTWIPLYLFFAFMVIRKYKLKGFYILLASALIVLCADQFASGFMKPYFERLRPCHEPSLSNHIRSLIDCGGQYGFISSHAANHFGLAVIFSWFFRKVKDSSIIPAAFFVWAALISYAQVYVGKHYPGDVIVGALAGLLIGYIILYFTKKIMSDNG